MGSVSLVCIIVMIVSMVWIEKVGIFQVEEKCVLLGTLLQCIHGPTDSLAACTHIHTQPGITDLRSVLHNREKRFYWRGYHDRGEEEAEEEEEEEEKVRHRAYVFYPHF